MILSDPFCCALPRYLVNAGIQLIDERGMKMTTTTKNTQCCGPSTQPTHVFEPSQSGFTLTWAVTFLCCLVISGLATSAIAQQKTLNEALAEHPDWMQIPGELIRPDCVHAIPKGARVELGNDGYITGDVTLNGEFFAHYDPCPERAIVTRPQGHAQDFARVPGTGNGWVEADQWNVPLSSSDNIDYVAGNWRVPSYPAVNGALIYLFNGIEPSTQDWILQPVLQYGNNGAFGGNYWGIASWLVSSTQAYVSPFETVNPGDLLIGYTRLTSISGSTLNWTILAQDQTSGAYSSIKVWTTGLHLTWAYRGVLEAYHVTSCSNFPSNRVAVFSNSVIDHDFPYYRAVSPQSWSGAILNYGGPSCGFAVGAVSGTLDF